ncbi:hypothetical protein BKP35_06585 [Anaerobacillus arseniciselenatis]|uniref:Acetyl-CoA acetyltransferase n=1 Tax=Anaerobacillus arseniciselenatis TaxID=85682 RepID=A0A1S2LPX8_9BACI|nr:hypothetical protein BKP35_06585 [Anaerobacillus arseniciselenatis]
MVNIIYSGKITDIHGGQLTNPKLKETFKEATEIHEQLLSADKRIAYFFIDPLLNAFEAANQFYFSIFECETIEKIKTYKSGASPIQALSDAKELVDSGLYDAVLIFGHEPLLTNKHLYGKEEMTKAMSIFEDKSILQCYNEIGHRLRKELELSEKEIVRFFDQLFLNFHKTYNRATNSEVPRERGRRLDDLGADLFKLTDCANPNINFSGGIIVANDSTASFLQIPEKEKISVSGVKYSMVEGCPTKIDKIVGKKEDVFPHLRKAFLQAQDEASIQAVEQFKNQNLYLEVYSCYPPIPIAFLLATGMIDHIEQLSDFLEQYEVTITGGMNFARAPWNNPALNALIEIHQKLKEGTRKYGLVHGNGGIGETQGVAILEKCDF